MTPPRFILNALPVHVQDRFFFSLSLGFYKVFWSPKASKLRSMLDLVLGGVLEAFWRHLGRVLGGQDAPQTAQDSAKTLQDGAKTAQDGAKTATYGAKM